MADVLVQPIEHILEARRRQFEELARPRGSLGAVNAEAQIRRKIKNAACRGLAEHHGSLFRERQRLLEAAWHRRLTEEEKARALDAERGFWR